MTIQEAIVQLLKADAGVSAITSSFYPQEAYADDVPPFGLYVVSDAVRTPCVAGYLGQFTATMRIDCYGAPPAYSSAAALAAAVEGCLLGFLQGVVTAADSSAVKIQGIFPAGRDDDLDPPLDGQEKGYDYCGVNLEIIYALSN